MSVQLTSEGKLKVRVQVRDPRHSVCQNGDGAFILKSRSQRCDVHRGSQSRDRHVTEPQAVGTIPS